MSDSATRWARGRWNVLRARRPRLTGGVETGLLGLRGRAHLADEVRTLRTRVAELERDAALLAAHVAALTDDRPTGMGAAEPGQSVEAVRLAAVAFYEQRIAALEARLPHPAGRRHARDRMVGTSRDGTSGYESENER